MFFTDRKWFILGLCLLTQACTQIDNYMLGKDNTPIPEALPTLNPKVTLREDWSVPIGRSSRANAYLKLKPVIQGDIVYTATISGTVDAVAKNTGKVLWSRQLKQGIVSGPTVAEGYVVVGTDASTVVVLKQNNGEDVWQFKIASDMLSKPLVTQHKVIAKTIDGNLSAYDLKNGEKLWGADHGSPSLILKASASPVLIGNLALVGFSDGKLDAIDITTGRIVWQRSIAFAIGASDVERLVDIDADPIVQGNIAYLASYQGYIGALSLSNGEFIWRKPASVYKNLAIDDSTLYATDAEDVIWAFDKQNGQVKWKQPALKARNLTEPIHMGNYLLVGDKTNFLHVLATNNGELVSRAKLSGPIDTAPAVSGNRIYVMTANGKLNSFTVVR